MISIEETRYENTSYGGHEVVIITSEDDEFRIQLDDNADFKEALGCLAYKNDKEFDIGDDEDISESDFDILIKTAEQTAYEAMFKKWGDKEFLFHCSFNNTSIYYQVHKESLKARIVSKDDYHNDYSTRFRVLKEFDDEEKLLEYAENFYTDDYHDFQGLYNMLQDLSYN